MSFQIKLKECVVASLATELQPIEIYSMASGIEIPDSVGKQALTRIFCILFKKLDWVEKETLTLNHSNQNGNSEIAEDPEKILQTPKWEIDPNQSKMADPELNVENVRESLETVNDQKQQNFPLIVEPDLNCETDENFTHRKYYPSNLRTK